MQALQALFEPGVKIYSFKLPKFNFNCKCACRNISICVLNNWITSFCSMVSQQGTFFCRSIYIRDDYQSVCKACFYRAILCNGRHFTAFVWYAPSVIHLCRADTKSISSARFTSEFAHVPRYWNLEDLKILLLKNTYPQGIISFNINDVLNRRTNQTIPLQPTPSLKCCINNFYSFVHVKRVIFENTHRNKSFSPYKDRPKPISVNQSYI